MIDCPYCGLAFASNAEFVDVGVGYAQVTGEVCDRCHASERGGHDSQSEMDKATGWFPPHFPSTVGPDTEWIELVLENVFAMGVRHGMSLAPVPGVPADTLAPSLAITMAPGPGPADAPF